MGFILRLFGILVTALALVGTAHYFGWLTLGEVLTPFAKGYTAFVTDVLFYPAGLVSAQWPGFMIAPHEALIITLATMLLLGPATLGPLFFDHEFSDAGPAGPFIVRLIFFFFTLSLFGFIAGFLPSPQTLVIFGGAIAVIAIVSMGIFFLNLAGSIGHLWHRAARSMRERRRKAEERKKKEAQAEQDGESGETSEEEERDDDEEGDDDEDREKGEPLKPKPALIARRWHFVGKTFLYFLLAALLLVLFDRFSKLEDDCLKLWNWCLMDVETPDKEEPPATDPEDTDEPEQ